MLAFYYENIIFGTVRRDTSIYAMNMKWNMLLLVGLFIWSNVVLGEGSKDLYPENIKGNRAFFVSQPLGNTVFANRAAHYAYVREGETIAVASSAQNIGLGRIRLTAPDGAVYQTQADDIGKISDLNGSTRAAELGGPRVGYVPYEVRAYTNQTGIWRVEFIPPDNDPFNAVLIQPHNLRADADWVQHHEGCLIAAWDISIRNVSDTEWLEGRVFMSMLQLHLSRESLADREGAFYGRNYVLTHDGYIYHIDGNGSHGIDFAYFVNSSGVLNDDGTPSYKSANQEKQTKFHNPNDEDNHLHITHKMFYNFPDRTMPKMSNGSFPGGKSWLFNGRQPVDVKDLGIKWTGNNGNRIDEKGISIGFETNCAGRYKVVISSESKVYAFKEREMYVEAKEGTNTFRWDGIDGVGRFIPEGKDYIIGIAVSIVEGEIHFPYFDMEINPNGILVDRMNVDGSRHSDAIMYWDDTAITEGLPTESSKPTLNRVGTPSRVDGHRWGTYASSKFVDNGSTNGGYGAYSYGNERVMDTWTYTIQLQAQVKERISVGRVGADEGGGASVPISQDRHLTLHQGGELVFDILNETAATDELLIQSIVIAESPRHGKLTLNDGKAVYNTKDFAYFEQDELTYRIIYKDGAESELYKVYFRILKTRPVATDDIFDVVYNTAEILEITGNDFAEYTDLNKESVRIVDHPANGSLMRDGDGNWTYQSRERYVGTDRFTYQIMDGNGNWSNTATVSLNIKGLFIPNTITPNGDSKNDTFQIIGLNNFDQVEVSIMDRFGRVVFASRDYRNNWSVPSNITNGVYFYVFKGSKYGQRPVINKGSLLVLTGQNLYAN